MFGRPQIGQFAFAPQPQPSLICLQLAWEQGDPVARVTSPPEVVDLLGDHDVGAREEDEFMSLAIALGYAVMISALSGVGMMISGDRSAWPAEWGDLVEVPSARVMQFRSH